MKMPVDINNTTSHRKRSNLKFQVLFQVLFLLIAFGCTPVSHLLTRSTPTPLPTVQVVEKIRWGRGTINDVVLSPDGTILAVVGSLGVWLYDIKTMNLLRRLEHPNAVLHITWSPDNVRLASASLDGSVRIWDVSGQQLFQLDGDIGFSSTLFWSPNGTWLASNGDDHILRIWDTNSGQQLKAFEKKRGVMAWSPDSTKLASVSDEWAVHIWDVGSSQQRTLREDVRGVESLTWSPDSEQVALAHDNKLLLLDVDSGRQLQAFEGHTDKISDVAWSPDGLRLASGSWDNTIRVWEAATGRQLDILEGLSENVESIAWSPDGTELAFGSWDRRTRVWRVTATTGQAISDEQEVYLLPGVLENFEVRVTWSSDGMWLVSFDSSHKFQVWEGASRRQVGESEGYISKLESVAWSPDGTQVAAGDKYGSEVRIWLLVSDPAQADNKMLDLAQVLNNKAFEIRVAWSPDGTQLAGVGNGGHSDGKVLIWDPITGTALYEFNLPNPIISVAWSPDGSKLALGDYDGSVLIWDVKSTQQIGSVDHKAGPIDGLAWSPDGTKLASNNGAVNVWDVAGGQQTRDILGYYPMEWVGGVAWSPDGTMLASAGLDETFQGVAWVWNMTNRQQLYELPGGSWDVAWSPDGAKLATSGKDIRIWDIATGQLLGVGQGHTDDIVSIDWSPDGTMLASASWDGTVRIWEIISP